MISFHQMKLFYFLPTFAALISASFGQADQNQAALENAPILDEVVHKQGKDTLVIQRIEQPDFLEEKMTQEGTVRQNEAVAQEGMLHQTYVISATSFGQDATRFQIWSPDQGAQGALEGWSNINWSVLQSLLSFDADNISYRYMLFHTGSGQDENAPEIPTELPQFEVTGARYLVTSRDEAEREEILDFLEAVHALYDSNKAKLHADRAIAIKRQEERKRQIKIEKAKPKTRVLKIWRHTRSEIQTSE